MFFTTILAFTLRFLLVQNNKRLEREDGESSKENINAVENYGPGFRYVL
jgi:hypothetical protein